MTPYQVFLVVVLVVWPFFIIGLLFLMNRIEEYLKRTDARTPEQAGLEPVSGRPADKEVRIVFGDTVVGAPDGD